MNFNQVSFNLLFFSMAWRNLWRYPLRSFLTILALAGGLSIVIFYAALIAGMGKQMVVQATHMATGYIQIHDKKFMQDGDLYGLLSDDVFHFLQKNSSQNSFVPRLYASALASSEYQSSGVQLRAIDPLLEPKVTALGTLNREAKYNNPLLQSHSERPVIVGYKLAKHLSLSLGDELILMTQAADGSIGHDIFFVEGIAKPIDPGFDRMGVLLSLQDMRELMVIPQGVHEIAVSPREQSLEESKADIIQVLKQYASLNTDSFHTTPRNTGSLNIKQQPVVRTWKELNPAISDILSLQTAVIGFIGLAVMFMASFGMLNTILMSIFERKHEFGILRAIGVKPGYIISLVGVEIAMLTFFSAILGNVVGYLLSEYFREDGINFSFFMPDGYDWAGLTMEPYLKTDFQWLAVQQANIIMLIVVSIATLFPLIKVMKKRPIELLV